MMELITRNKVLLVTYLQLLILTQIHGSIIKEHKYKIISNNRLIGNNTTSFPCASRIECVTLCAISQDCVSSNILKVKDNDDVCEMVHGDGDVMVTASMGWSIACEYRFNIRDIEGFEMQ